MSPISLQGDLEGIPPRKKKKKKPTVGALNNYLYIYICMYVCMYIYIYMFFFGGWVLTIIIV